MNDRKKNYILYNNKKKFDKYILYKKKCIYNM